MAGIEVKDGELPKLVVEFLEQATPEIVVAVGDTEEDIGLLDVQSTLAMWMQLPDCSYSSMFVGWTLAKGYDINSYSPLDLEKAVQVALVGDNKNVMFDYLGTGDSNDIIPN